MLQPGTQVGGYLIESVLGHGGMSVVYEARQLALDRKVAFKLLAPHLAADASFRERFRHEGRLQATLDHPHIVTVYEAGEIREGLYLAMRLIRGATLKDLIIDGEFDGARAIKLLEPIADALDTAHEAGLIHRDVKPQNILVDHRDHAYLADFGLMKGAGSQGMTRAGQVVGTVDYIAPEQIRGEEATGASDVYSFAAVVYESFTGSIPYVRGSDAAVMYAHLSEEPPRVTALRPGLPTELDEVIARGMAKLPSDRYATAGELLRDARDALSAPTQPMPVTPVVEIAPEPEPDREANGATIISPLPPALAQPVDPVEAPNDAPVPVAGTVISAPSKTVVSNGDGTVVADHDETVEPAPRGTVVSEPDEAIEEPDDVVEAAPDEVEPEPHETVEPEPRETVEPERHATVASAAGETVVSPGETVVSAPSETVISPGETVVSGPGKTVVSGPPAEPSRPRRRAVPVAAVAVVAAVIAAAVGYVVGKPSDGDDAPAPNTATVLAETPSITLRRPAAWNLASTAPAVPGLSLSDTVGFGPGSAAAAGVVAGRTQSPVGPELLPAGLVERVQGDLPDGEPVKVGDAAALRYSDLQVDGFGDRRLSLYVVPTTAGVAAAGCYRSPGADLSVDDCERVVGTLQLRRGDALPLGPDPDYGEALNGDVTELNKTRRTLREDLRRAKTFKAQAATARRLADVHLRVARSIAARQAAPAAADAQVRLAAALRATADGYSALAGAARRHEQKRYDHARREITTGEADVRKAIKGFQALGYTVR